MLAGVFVHKSKNAAHAYAKSLKSINSFSFFFPFFPGSPAFTKALGIPLSGFLRLEIEPASVQSTQAR
jgi:hypothetical protein